MQWKPTRTTIGRLIVSRGAFLNSHGSGLLNVEFDLLAEIETLQKFVQKYGDLPMSLADACLVRMAELNRGASVSPPTATSAPTARTAGRLLPLVAPS